MSYRYRRGRLDGKSVGAAAGVGLILAALVHGHAAPAAAVSAPGAAQAVAYAQAQLGSPYVWGGTGPYADGFDCSGLVQQAWASAGVNLPRTSQEQWANGDQVSTPAVGDLVYFAGADGTDASPGHVGIVTNPATDQMIDAYASGTPVRYDTYGPSASAEGLGDPVGFTDPTGG